MHRSGSLTLSLISALTLTAPLGRALAHDETVRAGVEFQVNVYTTGHQSFASAAMDADGDFVVTWHSNQDGGAAGIFARRYSKTGDAVGTEFQVNAYTPTQQAYPAVAVEGNGDFVVAWQSFLQDDDGSDGVFARRFSARARSVSSSRSTS